MSACGEQKVGGEKLAKTYCTSCHVFPEPSLLDKSTWEKKVLPEMAFRMGLRFDLLTDIPSNDRDIVMATLPDHPMVSKHDWELLVNYFLELAPDSLQLPQGAPITSLNQFDVEQVLLRQNEYPMITLLKSDTTRRILYVGNRSGWLSMYDFKFELMDSVRLTSPPSSMILADNELHVLQMGIMDPNDQSKGSLIRVNNNQATRLIDSLRRPVFFERADFNEDGRNDIVICSFGNFTGDLSVYEDQGEAGFKRHVLSALPGSRNTVLTDINNDGLTDVLALITQGDEQITAFVNKGDFRFESKILLRFPSVYGSSSFQIADFNHDGHFDILYTNGDNADYSPVLKPYHGVRIFLNNGRHEFLEHWFFPMYGCSFAMAEDFDQDGDLDIAAFSFFPDFESGPEKSFLYFENKNGDFEAHSTPLSGSGRWLVMESADFDGDGDADIVLGAFDLRNGVPQGISDLWMSKPASLLLLRNRTR